MEEAATIPPILRSVKGGAQGLAGMGLTSFQWAGWGWARLWKGTQLGQLPRPGQTDSPDCRTQYSTTQTVVEEERSRGLWFPGWPSLRGWLDIDLLVEDGERWLRITNIYIFFSFLHLLSCLYLNWQESSCFALPLLPPVLWRREEQWASGCVGAWLLTRVNPLHQEFNPAL